MIMESVEIKLKRMVFKVLGENFQIRFEIMVVKEGELHITEKSSSAWANFF